MAQRFQRNAGESVLLQTFTVLQSETDWPSGLQEVHCKNSEISGSDSTLDAHHYTDGVDVLRLPHGETQAHPSSLYGRHPR
ncbi:uncharacterized [Tachysurus ichikawai]